MILFHRTSAWREILRAGFKDGPEYPELMNIRGVWLSDVPLDANDYGYRNKGKEVLLEVHLDEALLSGYELVEEGQQHRAWCVPASLVNERATLIRVADRKKKL